MAEYIEKKCPQCGQQLRFPGNIGGVLMACPTCGKTFHSDFKLGSTGKRVQRGIATRIFELPCDILRRLGRWFTF